MKNGIKETRNTLEDALPNMMVVECDDPEQYVESKGLDVAACLTSMIQEETESIKNMTTQLRWNLSFLSDKDIEKIKDIISQKKAIINILQSMVQTYDEIKVDKSAASSLKKLLK